MEDATVAAPLPPSTPPIDQDCRADAALFVTVDGDEIMGEPGVGGGEIEADIFASDPLAAIEATTPDGKEGAEPTDYPSAEELVAKARAPVKHQFLRSLKGRTAEANVAPWSDVRRTAPQGDQSSQEEVQQNGAGNRPASKVSADKKSKRAMKKERQLSKKSPDGLCAAVAKTGDVNSCQYGASCRFNHDIASFLTQKPPELEGPCPFSSNGQQCPYGLVCRFASKHSTIPIVEGGEDKCNKVLSSEINVLNKEFQKKLWKNEVQFVKADAQLRAMGRLGKAKQSNNTTKNQAATTDDGSSIPDGAITEVDLRTSQDANTEALTGSEDGTNGHHERKRSLDMSLQAEPPTESSGKKAKVLNGDDSTEVIVCSATHVTTHEVLEVNNRDSPVARAGDNADTDHGLVKDDKELRLHARERKLVDFSGKLYVAPLTTVGNLPFRRLCKQLGADVTCGEMAMCTKLLQGQASEWALLRRHPSEGLFGVQICGSYPDSLARAAEIIDQECTIDFLDINVGCPIDIVVNKGAGSCLLTKPSRLMQIVAATVASMEKPLTVKVRTGYFEGKNCAHSLLPELSKNGASAVTVHGRTRQQRYSKHADWDYISQCAAQAPSSLQVIGNGDIFSYTDWNEHLLKGESKLSTCMLARGALIKPWLLTEIKEQRHWDISSGERLELLKDYVRYGLEHWGSDFKGVETTRHFLLEWLGYTHRYIPVELLEVIPQRLNWRPPSYYGRNDLETMMASESAADWVRISEMLLGPVPKSFVFTPKLKSNAYDKADNG